MEYPVEATYGSRSGAKYKLQKNYDFEELPVVDRTMHDIGEGYFFMISRIEKDEAGQPKRVYTNVDEKTHSCMRRNGWESVQ